MLLGANTSIASDRVQTKESYMHYHRGSSSNDSARSTRSTELPPPTITRKVPMKTNSLSGSALLIQPPSSSTLPRIVSDTFASSSMDRGGSSKSPETTPKRPRRRGFRAAESGKGDVLPSYNSSNSSNNNICSTPTTTTTSLNAADRSRTNSLSNMSGPFKSHNEPHHAVAHSLRSRKRGSIQSDDEGYSAEQQQQQRLSAGGGYRSASGNHYYAWPEPPPDDFSHTKGGGDWSPKHRSFTSLLPGGNDHRWMNMKSPSFIALVLLFCVACFTAGSYHKVFAASTQLGVLQREESLLLLHLHKVEEQLIQQHEIIRRLTDRSEGSMAATTGGPQRISVDSDLLDVQMRKLREMEAELDHEVRSLQSKLSESAKRSIVSNFGEGAVQVDLDVSFGENDNAFASNTITIRLWYDTPHTAWTFLQQVQNGSWNGAKFSSHHGRALYVQTENGGEVEPQVDFIEPSQKGMDKYTVGLSENGIILNIQDNRDYFKKEACVGVITQGFDTLRQLVNEVEGQHSETAAIRRASVSHLRKEPNAR